MFRLNGRHEGRAGSEYTLDHVVFVARREILRLCACGICLADDFVSRLLRVLRGGVVEKATKAD